MEYSYTEKNQADNGHKKQKSSGVINFGTFLVCVLMLAATLYATGADYFLNGIKRIGNSRPDYEAAFSALGDAISGERPFKDAVYDACTYAFGMQTENISVSRPEEEKDYGTLQDETEKNILTWTELNENIVFEEIAQDGADYESAVVAAFRETQEKYAAAPVNVTYDMPTVKFDYICPVEGVVSSHFGYRNHPSDGVLRFHYGTDIAADFGEKIVAFSDGRVTSAGTSSSYGKYVIIEHEGGVKSLYAHCSEVFVKTGDLITKGETIAAVGKSGNATGYCLHFEIIVNGTYVNPEYYVAWA